MSQYEGRLYPGGLGENGPGKVNLARIMEGFFFFFKTAKCWD